MSGLESDIANESTGAIISGMLFFAIGVFSRALVTKIDRALALSTTIGGLITVFIFLLGWRDNSLYNLVGYLAIWVYSSVVTQIGNTITGLTIRFLIWFKDEFL